MIRTERQTKTSGEVPTVDALTQLALTVHQVSEMCCEMALDKSPTQVQDDTGLRPPGVSPSQRAPAHLHEVLCVVLGGYKHHRLVLGSNDVAQQVEKHGSLGVLTHKEEGGLQGQRPVWAPG